MTTAGSALVLRALQDSDEEVFMAGLRAWDGGEPGWHSFIWREGLTYAEMLAILDRERRGVDLAPGRVPHSMLYALVDGAIVGRCSVRHELNAQLRRRGGHIGYAVAPPFRRRGHAGAIFRQGLAYCASLGLDAVMITCGDANVGSWRVIEAACGTLAETVWDDEDGERMRRYWLQLSRRA